VPRVVAVPALSIFVLGTSEFMITGLLPGMARDLGVSVPQTGYLISAFAIGMIVGPPVMAVLTLRLPRRTTLVASLLVFAIGPRRPGSRSSSWGIRSRRRSRAACKTGRIAQGTAQGIAVRPDSGQDAQRAAGGRRCSHADGVRLGSPGADPDGSR
jgi:MFS transporter, DHA1 family, chloramphenicol resistance protein